MLKKYFIFSSLLLTISNNMIANEANYVFPSIETPQVPLDGNADDPAIWLNKINPSSSLIFGTDKYRGIYTYNLEGQIIGFSKAGRVNNIDLRSIDDIDNSQFTTFIFGSNGTNNTLDLWVYPDSVIHQKSQINNFSLSVKPLISVKTNMLAYGVCAGHDKQLGLIAFVTEAKGSRVQVWQYGDNALKLIHTFNNSNAYESEGCVYDDENRTLFISEENDRGVIRAYKVSDALSFDNPIVIDSRDGNITGDPEGLSIIKTKKNDGYLVASSQGSSSFNVYTRTYPYTFIDEFFIGSSGSIDGASDTDGIDILNTYLNEDFPDGLMVVQDGSNEGEEKISKENFKYISLKDIMIRLNL